MKSIVKSILKTVSVPFVYPNLIAFWLQSRILGRERACVAAGQKASKWTGVRGEYFRYVFLKKIITRMGNDVVVSFGTILTKSSVEIGDRVYIGSYCLLGDVRIGKNTLVADHVCIPSGSNQHGICRLDIPIRDQEGEYRTVRIGEDCWIGSSSVILADVGNHCVIGAGSVVTKPVDDYQIVAGNPARVIGDRRNS